MATFERIVSSVRGNGKVVWITLGVLTTSLVVMGYLHSKLMSALLVG